MKLQFFWQWQFGLLFLSQHLCIDHMPLQKLSYPMTKKLAIYQQLFTVITKWTPIVQVANIFNRLIMYRGEYYHRSVRPGFGKNQFDGRLFQTFFFNVEE